MDDEPGLDMDDEPGFHMDDVPGFDDREEEPNFDEGNSIDNNEPIKRRRKRQGSGRCGL